MWFIARRAAPRGAAPPSPAPIGILLLMRTSIPPVPIAPVCLSNSSIALQTSVIAGGREARVVAADLDPLRPVGSCGRTTRPQLQGLHHGLDLVEPVVAPLSYLQKRFIFARATVFAPSISCLPSRRARAAAHHKHIRKLGAVSGA